MVRGKTFKLRADQIQPLVPHRGGCIASDRITVDGRPVGYMYREGPDHDADTGWRFVAGDESDEYMDNADNHGVYAVNTIANYDREIIPFLEAPIGAAFARDPESGRFEKVESPVDPDECLHPDFPVVEGDVRFTETWTISLPAPFNRRVEEGSLIFWRPGITIYLNAWNNDHDRSLEHRLNELRAEISPEAFDGRQETTGEDLRYSYRLTEDGVNALYGFIVAEAGHLQFAGYFDEETSESTVRSIFLSAESLPV